MYPPGRSQVKPSCQVEVTRRARWYHKHRIIPRQSWVRAVIKLIVVLAKGHRAHFVYNSIAHGTSPDLQRDHALDFTDTGSPVPSVELLGWGWLIGWWCYIKVQHYLHIVVLSICGHCKQSWLALANSVTSMLFQMSSSKAPKNLCSFTSTTRPTLPRHIFPFLFLSLSPLVHHPPTCNLVAKLGVAGAFLRTYYLYRVLVLVFAVVLLFRISCSVP